VPNESLPERLNGKLYRLFIFLIVAYLVVSCFAPMMNQVDLGWQVAQGRWMVRHAAPYSHDVFNYPNLGHPAINEYPLFEPVFYAFWSLGWWGPCVLTMLALVTLVFVVARGARRFLPEDSPLIAIAIGLMLLFLQVAFPLRPHLATYLGVAILGIFLLRHREAKNWTTFWPMALLQIAWTNCHSGFVLGPAMVGLFGCEMIIRGGLKTGSFSWSTARTWIGALSLILLACLVNPYGWQRFYPPFFQDRLESIRAYVGEMEPLVGGLATIYGFLALIALLVVGFATVRRNGAICFSFLLLAFVLFLQAEEVKKAWPVFGLFIPLLVLSSGAFATGPKRAHWPGVFGIFVASVFAGMALASRLDPEFDSSLSRQWQEYDRGRSELALDAVAWMKEHDIQGRLFHRCEDGGLLQQEGFDHGETFADTGFGKYDEAFIHEVGVVDERPAMLPHFISAYQPDFVITDGFAFQWPHILRQTGWRLIFYSPNSSVWTRPDMRPDLPTVSDDEIRALFDHDLKAYGIPADVRLLGRNIMALNSLGLEDFAFAKLTGLPKDSHETQWYWEAARFLCFAEPRFSAKHRDALGKEAEALGNDPLTAEFRAYDCYFGANDTGGALKILKSIPPNRLGNYSAELLLKIDLDQNRPDALALARRTDCFDLRNGRHWQYLAQAEEQAGNLDAARAAWAKAVFYFPDDNDLMAKAAAFAEKTHDLTLRQKIASNGQPYGQTSPRNQ
jgi:hypothetical protein